MKNIKSYIEARGYTCAPELVENYCLSLQSRPFLILTGRSDTDLACLPELIANAMGAFRENGRYRCLKVEYDWMDSSDLFGHLDLWGKFVPGPVLDFLIQARDDPEHPYFLCFDRLIFSRAEYYLREVLQTAQALSAGEEAPELVGKIYYGRDDQALERWGVVPALRNLYITATLALDETSFPLNQKLMDRVHTIHVEKQDVVCGAETAVCPQQEYSNDFLQTPFRSLEQCAQYADRLKNFIAVIEELNRILMGCSAYVGYQVRNDVLLYLMNNSRSGWLSREQALDHMITRKILVRAQGNARTVEPVLRQLLRFCRGRYPQAEKKLLQMLEQCEAEGYTGYWI